MSTFITDTTWLSPYLHAVLLLIVGFSLMLLVRHALNKVILKHLKQPNLLPINQFLSWFIFIIFIIMSLKQLGFELSLALQAAGFLTVALGFGLQGIASNFVCGLFLLADKTFQLGDEVQVNNLIGTIKVIQLLSISLIDDNNQLIRVPNELFFKSTVVNLSRCQTSSQLFKLSLHNCSLDSAALEQLFIQALTDEVTAFQCQLIEMDSPDNSITLICQYQCGFTKKNTLHNTVLEKVAATLTHANMHFRLTTKAAS